MIYPPNQKPPIWSIDPGIIAYNCRKAGMPHPALAMPMWEGAGNWAMDLSGHGNHGAITGAEWVADGLNFNTVDNYVKSGANINETEGSVSVWVTSDFIDNVDNNWYYLFDTEPSTSRLIFARDNSNNYAFFTNTIQRCLYTPPADLVGLHRWTVTYSTSGSAIYLDGVRVASASGDHSNGQNGTDFYIGSRYTMVACWDGTIADTQIFNTALSAAQAKFLSYNPYFMYQIPEELYGYVAGAPAGGNPFWYYDMLKKRNR